MRKCYLNRSWQQLSLELLLCAVCLIPYAHSLDRLPVFYEDSFDNAAKRQSKLDEDCRSCVLNFDSLACTRCTSGQPSIIPFYTAKRGYYMARSHPVNSNMCGCCALSRLSNGYCCGNCNAFKRGG
jgi:hypothetical protein